MNIPAKSLREKDIRGFRVKLKFESFRVLELKCVIAKRETKSNL